MRPERMLTEGQPDEEVCTYFTENDNYLLGYRAGFQSAFLHALPTSGEPEVMQRCRFQRHRKPKPNEVERCAQA